MKITLKKWSFICNNGVVVSGYTFLPGPGPHLVPTEGSIPGGKTGSRPVKTAVKSYYLLNTS